MSAYSSYRSSINTPSYLTTHGRSGYHGGDESSSEGQSTGTNMLPTLPHLNTNPISSAAESPGIIGDGMLLPTSAGATSRRAAPEPNKRALYVGGLDPRVTEDVLRQIFETTGHVLNVKIIPDKNFTSKGFNYGFIEYDDPMAAERAMATLNGRSVLQSEIRVNWAYQSNSSAKEDTSKDHHVFVGDISNEVTDEVLLQAFSPFGTVSEARVMWDMITGRSRGYGFVAFPDRAEAEKAVAAMQGVTLGARTIRVNWANQKGQPSNTQQQAMTQMGVTPTISYTPHQYPTQGAASYETVVGQTAQSQTTVYVGNLTPYTTSNDLVPLFMNFGYVVETRFQSDRGFAFVKMDTHESAAMAICQLSGYNIHGRPLKTSWGKDRPSNGTVQSPTAGPPSGYPATPATYFPQYGGPAGPMSPQGPNHGAQFPQSPQGYPQPYNAPYGRGGHVGPGGQYGHPAGGSPFGGHPGGASFAGHHAGAPFAGQSGGPPFAGNPGGPPFPGNPAGGSFAGHPAGGPFAGHPSGGQFQGGQFQGGQFPGGQFGGLVGGGPFPGQPGAPYGGGYNQNNYGYQG